MSYLGMPLEGHPCILASSRVMCEIMGSRTKEGIFLFASFATHHQSYMAATIVLGSTPIKGKRPNLWYALARPSPPSPPSPGHIKVSKAAPSHMLAALACMA